MIPASVPEQVRAQLLHPDIIVPPLLWLVSDASDSISGQRLDASRWRTDLPATDAAKAAMQGAGWPVGAA